MRRYSTVVEDYLKTLWGFGEWSREPATISGLAAHFGVSQGTASEAVQRLLTRGLVDHAPYGAVSLTDAGRLHALHVVRRHRLLECFLVQELGFGWDDVHVEAEVLEHAVSDRLVERIDAKLGRPQWDPHGDPIPNSEGVLPELVAQPLGDILPGGGGVIVRVHDRDPSVLKYLDSVEVRIGSRISVTGRAAAAGVIEFEVAGRDEPVAVGPDAAATIWVAESLTRPQ